MPIADRKFKRFTLENVNRSPRKKGVYALYAKSTLVYLGQAAGHGDTIRSRLCDHFAAGDRSVTRYKREPAVKPQVRLKKLLEEHVASFGHLPARNAPES